MNEVQMRELDILKHVVQICECNHLRYFITGGTLIGAIRHNGFIPWDDDIDIGMPRSDYERFRTFYYRELPDYLEKIDYDVSEQYSFLFTKVHDTRTTYIGNYCKEFPDWYTGVFIDIFPYDGIPDRYQEQRKYLKKIKLLKSLNNTYRIGGGQKNDSRGIRRAIKLILQAGLRHCIPYNYFSDRLYDYVRNFDFDKSEYIYSIGGAVPGREEKYIRRREWYEPIRHIFENIEVTIPSGYHNLLEKQYGDYMQIPPVEQQVSHEIYFYDLDLPVDEYKKHIKGTKA